MFPPPNSCEQSLDDAYIYPTSLPWERYDTRSVFEQNAASLNLLFSFFITKAKNPSLPYYLPIAKDGKKRWI